MATPAPLKLGTRASPLARWQAEHVSALLQAAGHRVELVLITTLGDTEQSLPLGAMGGQGVFTKEIQKALLEKRIDLAVHSLKDLPTLIVPGLVLAAVPERGPTHDVLVSRHQSVEALPQGAWVGTGSIRRRAQLAQKRADLRFCEVRGNVDTRLRKLDEGQCDALVLAEAGLARLGLENRIAQRLPHDWMLPAVGQGALGIECREEDALTRGALASISHQNAFAAVLAERSLLRELQAGCLAPVAALATVHQEALMLQAAVIRPDGKLRLYATERGQPEEAVLIGKRAAELLFRHGAADIVDAARKPAESAD